MLRLVDDGVPETEIVTRFRCSPDFVARVITLAAAPRTHRAGRR